MVTDENMDIPPEKDSAFKHETLNSPSRTSTSLSQSQSRLGTSLSRIGTGAPAKPLKPFATEDIKILLLENVNQTGRDILTAQGYQVEALKSSLPEDELISKIRWAVVWWALHSKLLTN